MKKISVIICSYNPEESIFKRCLAAITIAANRNFIDEILIIDNNSSKPIETFPYIQEFQRLNKQTRIYIEPKQGLTPARLLGIEKANGDILVFIDDDNFIEPDFFEMGLLVGSTNPNIGAWSGQVKLEFEKEPEQWTRKYWGLLVFREFNADYWSNLPLLNETMPCGAGLFIRKQVGSYYFQLHKSGKRDIQLDRTGKSLFSGGDNDMAACACDMGMGVGLFHQIKLVHYIPAFRLELPYLLKLTEGIFASSIVLKSYRGSIGSNPTLKNTIANGLRILMKGSLERKFFKAVLRGEKAGRQLLKR